MRLEIISFNVWCMLINPLTPMRDQDIISPYNIKHRSDENKEKYQLGDY